MAVRNGTQGGGESSAVTTPGFFTSNALEAFRLSERLHMATLVESATAGLRSENALLKGQISSLAAAQEKAAAETKRGLDTMAAAQADNAKQAKVALEAQAANFNAYFSSDQYFERMGESLDRRAAKKAVSENAAPK